MSRRYLIAVSIVAHLAIGIAAFTSGVWRIERLDNARGFSTTIAMLVPTPPPPAPAGGHKPDDPTPKKPHRQKPPVLTQLDDRKDRDDTPGKNTPEIGPGDTTEPGTCLENCGPATAQPQDPVCGNNVVEIGETCDDGNKTSGDGCSATCQTEPRRAEPPPVVPPTALHRIAGDTSLHPTDDVKNRMLRDGKTAVKGNLKICVAADGSVTSATMIGTTGYPEYDAVLTSGARGWRYQPVTINGQARPACSAVTFLYHME